MDEIINSYSDGSISGWGGEELAREQFDLIQNDYNFVQFKLFGDQPYQAGKKAFLYQVVRKALGTDIENVGQLIGDCVAWGGRNACEYLACCDILLRGDNEQYRPVYVPYYYGTSRVQIGGGRISGDGSLGSWMAAAVMKYGTVFSDEKGLPSYSESVGKSWGKNGPPKEFLEIGKKYLVKSAAKIKGWDELVDAICNGYPCTVASDQGFEMAPDANGFHNPKGTWQHQMAITGIDDEWKEPYALIRNSWGDAHGKLMSFHVPTESIPIGYLRVKKKTIERMIGQGEVYAWSQFEGFKQQDIQKALFKIVGE